MEKLISVSDYRNYLIAYYQYECDLNMAKLEQRKQIINKFYSDQYLQTIVENTKRFNSMLLEYMKKEDHVINEKVITTIELNHTTIDINNGCSGGFHSDTLIRPLILAQGSYISSYLLQQSFPDFTIEITHDSYEERFDDMVTTFPLDELHISCPKEVFNEIYNSNSNKSSHKKLVK